ncbi:MAG: hypothetical protein JHD16_11940 [Solirubrobacteraceae bacterium]|nr:hypothetical protein [Solirubrobacteraceae bacterium]
MFEPTTSTATHRRRRGRRGRALLAACVAAAALGAVAGTATAADTTTKWYSIDQQPASAASPAQFLTATGNGQVTLDRYKSGEWRQQWAPTYPEWPSSPTITSNSPFADFFEAFAECIVEWGCPFSGNASNSGSPRKYVNRMYARCLTFKPTGSVTTRVIVSRCAPDGTDLKGQVFTLEFPDETMRPSIPRAYTEIFGTRGNDGRCLDSAGGAAAPGTNAAALDCGMPPAQQWRQEFRFLQSASATCRRNYPGTLCGLGAPVR